MKSGAANQGGWAGDIWGGVIGDLARAERQGQRRVARAIVSPAESVSPSAEQVELGDEELVPYRIVL